MSRLQWSRTGGSCNPEHMGQVQPKVRTLNFKEEEFQVFREIVSVIPWETALRDKEQNRAGRSVRKSSTECKSWLSMYKKLGKEGKRPAWLSRTLSVKLQGKKQSIDSWSLDRGPGKSVKMKLSSVGLGPPTVTKSWIHNNLRNLNLHKPLRTGEMHPRAWVNHLM